MHVAGGTIVRLVDAALAGRASADVVNAVFAVIADAIRVRARTAEARRIARRPVNLVAFVTGASRLEAASVGAAMGHGGEGEHSKSHHSHSPFS